MASENEDSSPRSQPSSELMAKQPVMTSAFSACVLVMFVDILGFAFVQPVLLPYGFSLGASLEIVAAFNTVRFGCNFISMFWMPPAADKFGKKFLILISIAGSAVAYFLQGFAAMVGSPGSTQIAIMFAGRAMAGFFGGTKPVLQNVVTVISQPDQDLVRTRLTLLSASEHSFGVALAPLAGALAQFSLNIPWLVASLMSVLIFIITLVSFNEPKMPKKVKKADKKDGSTDIVTSDSVKSVQSGNPMGDKYLLLLCLSMTLVGLCVSGSLLVMPMLLSLPSFGLSDGFTQEQQQKNIANAAAVAGVPMGIGNLTCSTFVFLAVVRRLGEAKTMLIGGSFYASSFIFLSVTTSVWQVALLTGFQGCGLGLFIPGFGPAIAKWAFFKFPDRGAQASAVPFLGFTAGMMVGPLVMSALVGDGTRGRIRTTYFVTSGIFFVQIVLTAFVVGMIQRAIGGPKKTDDKPALTPEQLQLVLKTGAVPADEWIDDMCNSLREYLTKGSPQFRGPIVWHGIQQKYWKRILSDAFPQLPMVDDTNPEVDFAQSDVAAAFITQCYQHFWSHMTDEEKQFASQAVPAFCPKARLPGQGQPTYTGFAVDVHANMGVNMGAAGTADLVRRTPYTSESPSTPESLPHTSESSGQRPIASI